MTCSGVCLRAMIREFPPVSILGHETHTDTGLLPGDPTTCIYGRAKVDGDGELNVLEFESTLEPATVTILLTDSRFTTAYCSDWKRVSSVGSLDLGSLFGS
jgi:hypothetical protein